jgi:peptidoglycan/LPS O-acetylase OafA/YrhL
MLALGKKDQTEATAFHVLDLLDFCKGVAILGIFFVHWRPAWFGWQGVSVFIVLSGLGLTYACLKRGDSICWKDWYLKRLRKILPGYWLVCLWGYLTLVGMYLLQGKGVLNAIALPLDILFKTVFLLDLTLLNPPVKIDPNGALWFIPFIIGFYFAFPVLYRWLNRPTIKGVALVGLGMMGVQWIYAAVMIRWFDGLPIGFGHYAKWFPVLGVPFDRLPDSFPFQRLYPFIFFPARLGELGLGMMGAIALSSNALTRNSQKFHQMLLNPWTGALGVLIWLAGNALIFRGFWGWIFADFVIALGLILGLINLAAWVRKTLPLVFSGIQALGTWSYHIFLTHFLIIFIFQQFDEPISLMLGDSRIGIKLLRISLLFCMVLGTGIATWLLRRFDRSKAADLVFDQTIARVFKVMG